MLTLWLLVYAYQFIDGVIAAPINRGIRVALVWSADYIGPLRESFGPSEAQLQEELVLRSSGQRPAPSASALTYELRKRRVDQWWASQWWTNLIGVGVAIVAVYLAGRLVGGFMGRRIYQWVERLFAAVPLVRAIYPSVKQVVDFLFSEEKTLRFSRVVAVEYPRKGVWSIGLVTAERRHLMSPPSQDTVTVFVPSSPTPFTGYTIMVPRVELLELPITIDQALRYLVSGGVLSPEGPESALAPGASVPASAAELAGGRAAGSGHRTGAPPDPSAARTPHE